MANAPTRGLFFPGGQAAAPAAGLTAAARARPVPRRLALRWAGWGALTMLVGGWAQGFLSFFSPRKASSLGTRIIAGTVDELTVGQVKLVTEGRFYLVRVPEGFIALWWKCPHLGCTIPWRDNEDWSGEPTAVPGDAHFAGRGRFNCPCHGSRYDRYGQIVKGPAPRPMDRFPLVIEGGTIKVETGATKAIVRERAGPDDAVPG
jgi:cytochrome b6-f complex iron-sulfur subunit